MDNWISPNSRPYDIFKEWFEAAQPLTPFEPTKMTLATVDSNGLPAARVVLLKKHDERGLCFFTNFESAKAAELTDNPKAAVVFHWQNPFHRQVRVRGLIEKMTWEESNAYFQTRARGSQIGAWASPQSSEIQSREQLQKMVEDMEERFKDVDVIDCPKNWGGFRLKPLSYEFWQAQEFRLHDRMKFVWESHSETWKTSRLAP